MKRHFLFFFIALSASIALPGVFPAHTSIELAKHRMNTSRATLAAQHDVELSVFITVDDPIVLHRLRDMGMRVSASFDNVATAKIPLNAIADVAKVKGVKSVRIARALTLYNDKALELSRFPSNPTWRTSHSTTLSLVMIRTLFVACSKNVTRRFNGIVTTSMNVTAMPRPNAVLTFLETAR